MSKILVVDDTQDTRDLLHFYLAREGFTVTVAVNGNEGLYLATLNQPDLIITDVTMPMLDGLQMITELRAVPELADVPIIAITAYGVEATNQALEMGANRALHKPMELEKLIEQVKDLLPASSCTPSQK